MQGQHAVTGVSLVMFTPGVNLIMLVVTFPKWRGKITRGPPLASFRALSVDSYVPSTAAVLAIVLAWETNIAFISLVVLCWSDRPDVSAIIDSKSLEKLSQDRGYLSKVSGLILIVGAWRVAGLVSTLVIK